MTKLASFFRTNKNRWEYATWVDRDIGFFFVETPKVGCTTIKQVLQMLSGKDLPPTEQAIHYRNPPSNFVGSVSDILDDTDAIFPELLSFSFVRHPLTRLYSAFKDKIIESPGPFWSQYRYQIRDLHSLGPEGVISFQHFIDYVQSLPDSQRDIHWRSQFALLRPDIIAYSKIGCLETFDEDFIPLLSRLTSEPTRYYSGQAANYKGHQVQKEQLIPFAQQVAEIFASDYEAFGYTSALS